MNTPHDRSAWLQGGEATCRTPPARPVQPRRIVLLGPPGIGKGTQAGLLDAAFGACYLSTGAIFRHAQAECPSGGDSAIRTALDYTRRGDTVPDDTLLELINERLRCLTCSGGFILDGFPRTVQQAKLLDLLLESHDLTLDAVILYELPSSLIVPRLLGRRICPTCHRFYHVKNRPPHATDVCDDCLTPLVQLTTDRIDTIRLISGHHLRNSQPLLNYYRQRKLLVAVSAQGSPEEVFERTIDAFRMSPRGSTAGTNGRHGG
jgi:adenylate kinase